MLSWRFTSVLFSKRNYTIGHANKLQLYVRRYFATPAVNNKSDQQYEIQSKDKKRRSSRDRRTARVISKIDTNSNSPRFFANGSSAPPGFWTKDPTNQRRFFDWAAQQLGLKTMEDWYGVRVHQIHKLGGGGLISALFGNSLQRALSSVYPDYEWLPWRFSSKTQGFWQKQQTHESNNESATTTTKSTHRQFFDWAGKQLGVKTLDDWYNVTLKQIQALGGAGLLSAFYNSSLHAALASVYPEHQWQPWRFSHAPHRFWKDSPENHRLFFDWAAKQLGVHTMEDWYSITTEQIHSVGGSSLLMYHYNSSLQRALAAVYPEYSWLPWRFVQLPKNFWKKHKGDYGGAGASASPPNQYHQKFFDWAAEQMGLKSYEDWYNVSVDQIRELGGEGLLRECYNGQLHRALVSVYPDKDWQLWRFNRLRNIYRTPTTIADDSGAAAAAAATTTLSTTGTEGQSHTTADNMSELRRYVEHLAEQCGVKHLDDWYRVSLVQLRELGAGSPNPITFFEQRGGLSAVLRRLYPEHDWSEERFHHRQSSGKRSTQRQLLIALKKLIPDQEVFEEYHHPHLRYGASNELMRLDICIPALSLAFEYQGEQHYRDIHRFGNPSMIRARDSEKHEACKLANVTLIVIPYWWNRSLEDLAATICAARPDLATASSSSSTTTTTTAASGSTQQLQSPLALAAAKGTPISQSPP